MRLALKALVALALCTGIATSAISQGTSSSAETTANIEAMRTVIQTERKILVMREMTFTSEEAEQFWPLYDEYRAEAKKIGNLRVNVITEYAANYTSMTDELAKQLLDESVKFQEEQLKLNKKYLKKFRKILPEIKVARYFQLENKLDAIVNYDLAAQIPLMQ